MTVKGKVQVYTWKDIPSRTLTMQNGEHRAGITHRDFRGDNVSLGYNEVTPDFMAMPHQHPYEQLFLILEGHTRLHVEDEVFECPAGSIVRIPPNVMHWAEAPKEGLLVNLDIFTPLRPEYAKHTSYQTDEFLENTDV